MQAPATCPAGHGPALADLPLKNWIARMANGISPASLLQAHTDWLVHLMVSPSRQADLSTSAMRKAGEWMQESLRVPDAAAQGDAPAQRDARFARHEWRQWPFAPLAHAFLLQQQWWAEATHGVRGVSRHHEDVVSFVARQWLDMLSPSNFIATNPQVLRETAATGGANLASGFANWFRDAMAVAAGGKPRGVEAFLPGQGVALTPGRVVMRNDLAELIQYEPATPTVRREPVLIVPSWIMKFYILDLTPQDSLVRYLVGQGHTVFMVSWRNPGAADAGLGMEDYLQRGVFDALRAVQAMRPRAGIHGVGYCLGGTLLAIAAAALAREHAHPLKTATLLAAQVDFSEPGELGLFIDESQVAFVEDLMAARGYLDGREMAGAFQLINSRDLVWSKLVHEYLMGAQTPVTPLRAWNADATRMPARMHAEYLRSLYLRNDLAEGRYKVKGEPVDLADIRIPLFVVATERDHVSPWKSVYRIHRLTRAEVSFLLTSGGHNVGIVNPPQGPSAHPQAQYRFATHAARAAPVDPAAWLSRAGAPAAGSWWPRWEAWLDAHSGGSLRAGPVAAKIEGEGAQAPGRYVLE